MELSTKVVLFCQVLPNGYLPVSNFAVLTHLSVASRKRDIGKQCSPITPQNSLSLVQIFQSTIIIIIIIIIIKKTKKTRKVFFRKKKNVPLIPP